jgi:hypothetical protein
MDNPNISDLIGFAMTKQPTGFMDAFNNLIGQRALEKIEQEREDVAKSYFGGDEEEEGEEEYDEDDEHDDMSDEELEDALQGINTDEDS